LVGTQVDANKIELSAGNQVVLAAAQDVYTFHSEKKKKGFLGFSKKTTTIDKLEITNKGVSLKAMGDVDVIAEKGDLTTAGTNFVSTTGDINLTSVEGNIYAGAYKDVISHKKVTKKSSFWGLISSNKSKSTVSEIAKGTSALANLDLSLVSGGDTTLVGANLSAGGKLNIQTGGDFSVEAAISSQREDFFSQSTGLVLMTTITENSFVETAILSKFMAGQGMTFDIAGDTKINLYNYAGVDNPAASEIYPEELLAIAGAQLITQQLADEYFYANNNSYRLPSKPF
jgi:hypothetical protein